MLRIDKRKFTSRQMFLKPFYRLYIKLKVIENNYLFIGSSKDEIKKIPDEIFKKKSNLDEKLKEIAEKIQPMRSTTLIGGRPFIPGSSLKGMIRFYAEHSFKANKNGVIFSCFIKQSRPERKELIRRFLTTFGYWPDLVPAREKENLKPDSNSKEIPTDYCKICDLFGNSNIASRVVISDAKPLNNVKLVELNVSDKWKDIRRLIAPDSEFIFTINVNNAELLDLAIIYLGMNLPNVGNLLLGMNKFAPLKGEGGQLLHFGKIKLEIMKIEKFIYNRDGFREEIIEGAEILEFNSKIFDKIKNMGDIIRNLNFNLKREGS